MKRRVPNTTRSVKSECFSTSFLTFPPSPSPSLFSSFSLFCVCSVLLFLVHCWKSNCKVLFFFFLFFSLPPSLTFSSLPLVLPLYYFIYLLCSRCIFPFGLFSFPFRTPPTNRKQFDFRKILFGIFFLSHFSPSLSLRSFHTFLFKSKIIL